MRSPAPSTPRAATGRCWCCAGSARRSRPEPIEHAREGNRLPHVVETGDPRQRALDADSEPGMRDGAVASQVLVPLEGLLRQAVLVDAARELFQRRHALAAADDLAVALRRQAIH